MGRDPSMSATQPKMSPSLQSEKYFNYASTTHKEDSHQLGNEQSLSGFCVLPDV
jgi:hypothetical protein